MTEDLRLKVVEALQEEAYKGIVRIDTQTMKKLNIRPGDIIEIEGGRKTVAIVERAYPTDIGQSLIRMDGIVRRNAKTGIGEVIKVRNIEIKEAKSITIAPVQKGIMIQAPPRVFKEGLAGRAVMKGDVISLGGTRSRRRVMSDSPFQDIFDMFEANFMGNFGFSDLRFIVVETNPKTPVIITENTNIEVSPQAVEVKEEKVSEVSYEDIGGLDEEIKKVREMVELPLKHPEIFERLGVQPPKGILMFGPPGTGKTLLAKAVASESDANFFVVNGPELTSKFYGESEKRVRDLFERAEKEAPSIIFIDELDAMAPKREETYGEVERRMVSQLLTCMDGLKSRGKVVVIGATNRPNAIDPALRRPGRFDRELQIGVPNKQGRLQVLKVHTRNMPLMKDVDLEYLANVTHGFVGADVSALCKEAAMVVLRKLLPELKFKDEEEIPDHILEKLKISQEDFIKALRMVSPSAMREVLIERPNVKWADIGGLENLKQELKEAVEWPFKNPEAFKRLGIKAPKGILMYGPPGTGKTLLAKAVASESEANFILVKGPELLNKWVGESLPYDEEILVINDDMFQRAQIGEIVENNKNEILAPTITNEYQSKNSKVIDFIRHPAPPYIDKIVTETGRVVRVTGGHSLFIKDKNGFREILADEIIPNETRIAVPLRLESIGTIKEINILNKLKELDKNTKSPRGGFYVCNGQNYIKEARMKLGSKKISRLLDIRQSSVFHYENRAATRVHKFLKLMKEADINYDPKKLELTSWIRNHKLPAVIPVTEDLGLFLGIWAAEGSYFSHGVRLSLHKKEYEFFEKLIKKLFGNVTIYTKKGTKGTDLLIGSTLLKTIMKEILNIKSGAKDKHVPGFIFSANKKIISEFLKGYFSGDAYFHKKMIEASTISKKLANDLLTLLLHFGIVARCKTKKEWNSTISYRIRFIWKEFLRKFIEKIGFIEKGKNDKILNYIDKKFNRDKLSPARNIDKDVYWDLVVNKIREPYTHPYVYDISINPTERFIAGFGGILVHNSEKGVRKVFERARQAAPTIIFFDEIDAMAGSRGRYTGDSGVTEKVVNTLLAEMDGLEELQDVIVIAATNRPDLIDPGLLRPGRFDRIIATTVPDKKSRENIFNIHTKGMPLAKDVNLKELIDKTDNYSGADIAGVCREAGLLALREDIKAKEIKMKHFEIALTKVRSSITDRELKKYKQIEEEYLKVGRGVALEKPSYLG